MWPLECDQLLYHYNLFLVVDKVPSVASAAGRERELSPSMDMDNQDEVTEGTNKVCLLVI